MGTFASRALGHFGISDHRLVLTADSFNTVFRVLLPGASYVLRVAVARTIHEAGAAFAEHDWTHALADRGLPVPRVVRAEDGSPSVAVLAEGVPGARECTLLTWTPGRALARPIARKDLQNLAVLCARMHAASTTRSQRPPGVLDGRHALHFRVPNLIDELPGPDHNVFRDALAAAQSGIDVLWREAADAPRLIHSDLTPNNVLRTRTGLAAIDFQDLSWGQVEQDLANSLYGITRGIDVQGAVGDFRASYEQVRRWPALSDGLLPDLIAARRLEMVNLSLAMNRPGLDEYLQQHAVALRNYLR